MSDEKEIYFLNPLGVKQRQINQKRHQKKILKERNSFPKRVQGRLNLDPEYIRSCGQYTDCVYLNKFYFKATAFDNFQFSKAINQNKHSLTRLRHRGSLPDPLFLMYKQFPKIGWAWKQAYLFEEVFLVCRHLDELFKVTSGIRYDSPEVTLMNNELEVLRDSIRRSLIDGDSITWS